MVLDKSLKRLISYAQIWYFDSSVYEALKPLLDRYLGVTFSSTHWINACNGIFLICTPISICEQNVNNFLKTYFYTCLPPDNFPLQL